jgi:hypothetical protein
MSMREHLETLLLYVNRQNFDSNRFTFQGLQLGWKIIVDNDFMPRLPRYMAEMRPNIPVMFGSNRDEFALYCMDIDEH